MTIIRSYEDWESHWNNSQVTHSEAEVEDNLHDCRWFDLVISPNKPGTRF